MILGINSIKTANQYTGGFSEQIIGKVVMEIEMMSLLLQKVDGVTVQFLIKMGFHANHLSGS
jgi:predicted aldo/keto reductase-like oxidoreductase